MFVRIVKMSFETKEVENFKLLFEEHRKLIRNFEGCQLLELYQDKSNKNVFFTYSYWKSEADLEKYRHSDLFESVWSATKKMFNDKPQAWSVDKLIEMH
ncbi:MAG: putative quinol monooxygenase [Bacteroidota bacterium]